MLPLSLAWAHETELSIETGILELWDITVPIISGTSADIICSFSPSASQRDQYQSQGVAQVPSATQIGQRGLVWVEVEDRAHGMRLQGPKGVFTPSHHSTD